MITTFVIYKVIHWRPAWTSYRKLTDLQSFMLFESMCLGIIKFIVVIANVYVCVYFYVYIYVFTHIYAHMCVYVNMYECVCTCLHVCVFTCAILSVGQ